MNKDRLTAYLAQGLSLIQIGTLENRDPSTVGYWVEKYGLEANGRAKYAPRGGLARDQLVPLVESGATLQEMAGALDRSIGTVRYWLDKHGLKVRNGRGRRPCIARDEVEAALANGQRTIGGQCRVHGDTIFVIENSRRVRCRECRKERVVEWRRRTKPKLVEEAGGCCRLCGYGRCMAALEFHHLDPAEKEFGLSVNGITRSIEKIRAEAAKCILLCSNCHAEVEVGFAKIRSSPTWI